MILQLLISIAVSQFIELSPVVTSFKKCVSIYVCVQMSECAFTHTGMYVPICMHVHVCAEVMKREMSVYSGLSALKLFMRLGQLLAPQNYDN